MFSEDCRNWRKCQFCGKRPKHKLIKNDYARIVYMKKVSKEPVDYIAMIYNTSKSNIYRILKKYEDIPLNLIRYL